MDRVKAQANSLAQQANAGMAKLDNLPVQRKSDALLRSLGVAVLAERTNRGNPQTSAEIDQLVTEITQYEAQHGIDIVQQAAQAAAEAQMRMGPSPYIASSPTATNPNVSGMMPGAPGAGPGYGPPSAPGGFPGPGQPGDLGAFPGAGQQPGPTSFTPEPPPGGWFGEQAGAQAFPQAGGPTSFPEAVPVTSFPPTAAPADFPGALNEPAAEWNEPDESGFTGQRDQTQ
jgi:hypothetical protein